MQKDSTVGTLVVATALCVICSVLVAGSAVSLKDRQEANKKLDVKKNLLQASGLLAPGSASREEIEEAYKNIEAAVVNLETGKVVSDMNPTEFSQLKASKDPDTSKRIQPSLDKAGIKRRSKFAPAYKYMKEGKMAMLILPVNGKGLWSTLYGFLALDTDLKTVKGIGFYQHGETPGLGGEIDNIDWKAKWAGKKIFDGDQVALKVIKGQVSQSDPNAKYKIDGLSGATITSNGVSGLIQYWMGEDGFGPYLENLENGTTNSSNYDSKKAVGES